MTKQPPIQVRGDVAEALDLFLLGGQVRDRVAQEVGERERSAHLGSREIADRHADLGRTRLRLELRDHGGRELDPVDANPAPAQRQRDPTGPDTKLERRAGACEIGHERAPMLGRSVERLRELGGGQRGQIADQGGCF